MKSLITGITGFVGSHLAEYLLASGETEVYGTYRVRSPMTHLLGVKDRLQLVECELTDASSVTAMIEQVQPDRIYHLAAQSFVPTSWNAPVGTLCNNIVGEIHLFEAVRRVKPTCRMLIAGSSEEYGFVLPEETPIREENPLRPLSPYGVSKVAQDLLGYQYHQSYGLDIVRTRAFNHEGPRRGEAFVLSNFAKQIAQIEQGQRPAIVEVGNLDAVRDFTDVRDIVRAYVLALDAGLPGEVYNIGSTSVWTIREALNQLLHHSNMTVQIVQDAARLRPSDVTLLHADATKFRKQTGWKPEIPFDQTIRDLLDYWRPRVVDKDTKLWTVQSTDKLGHSL